LKSGEAFNPRRTFVGVFIPESLAAASTISSTAKLAYGHLVRRAGENGRCWPSVADVRKHIGLTSDRAAQRVLRELQSGDPPLIRATNRTDARGRQTSNEYYFIWGPLLEGDKNVTPDKNVTLPLTNSSPSGVTKTTPPGVTKTSPEKRKKKSTKGKVSDEDDETSSTAPRELSDLLPEWLDSDAQNRIWRGCRNAAGDCTIQEIAAATTEKIQLLADKCTTGLLITGVPKMFVQPNAFHDRARRRANAERQRNRAAIEAIACDESAPEADREWARKELTAGVSNAA
jgi:hypothetical protein